MAKVDYKLIVIPDGKEPKSYSYAERRSELLKALINAGHYAKINQCQAAERYGVTQGQISQDMKVLRGYLAEELSDTSETNSLLKLLVDSSIKKFIDRNEPEKALEVLLKVINFQFDSGDREKVADKVEVTHSEKEEKLKEAFANLISSGEPTSKAKKKYK